MRPHRDEIIRWANNRDAKVWYRSNHEDGKWVLGKSVSWWQHSVYIVDDEWAELRKAQADGKLLQCKNGTGDAGQQLWRHGEVSMFEMANHSPSMWRVEPIEKKYEWQWLYKNACSGLFRATETFYTDSNPPIDSYPIAYYGKIIPSKRERKDDK